MASTWLPPLADLLWAVLLFVAHLITVARALTRANRTPAARVAWVATIMLLPIGGVLAYLLLGETSIGRGRFERLSRTAAALRLPPQMSAAAPANAAEHAAPLLDLGRSINGFDAVGGNRITLLGDAQAPASEPMRNPKAAMDVLIADIGQARRHVHIAFYIWLDDDTGTRVAQAVAAAAQRGVQCRVMVDALGSRAFHGGPLWRLLAAAGVQLLATLDDVNRIWHVPFSRMDLRDHRKLAVIDNRIGYCGSQNCADPEFRVKARYAPWVDVLLRCQGPVVRQMQCLFLSGWIPEKGEDALVTLPAEEPLERFADGAVAQVFETGPVTRHNAMSDMFTACMYAARKELLITTPYFVPDEALLAWRGLVGRAIIGRAPLWPGRQQDVGRAGAKPLTWRPSQSQGIRHTHGVDLAAPTGGPSVGRVAVCGAPDHRRACVDAGQPHAGRARGVGGHHHAAAHRRRAGLPAAGGNQHRARAL